MQGLPLKYALAMAISQARDVGSGRRTVHSSVTPQEDGLLSMLHIIGLLQERHSCKHLPHRKLACAFRSSFKKGVHLEI